MALLDTKTTDVMSSKIAELDETKDERYYLEEYFRQLPCINADLASGTEATREPANNNFEILGANMTSALVTFSATNAGLLLTTATADNDAAIIAPHLDTKQTAWAGIKWGTENQVEWTGSIKTGSSVATTGIWCGLKLTNTEVIATDNDQAYFRYNTDDSNTTWHVITSRAGTDVDFDTGVAVAANTQYKMQIKIDAFRVPRFYINDVLVYTGAALENDIDLIPYIGVIELVVTTASTLIVNYEKISRILFE
jgi:hypothetical protein